MKLKEQQNEILRVLSQTQSEHRAVKDKKNALEYNHHNKFVVKEENFELMIIKKQNKNLEQYKANKRVRQNDKISIKEEKCKLIEEEIQQTIKRVKIAFEENDGLQRELHQFKQLLPKSKIKLKNYKEKHATLDDKNSISIDDDDLI